MRILNVIATPAAALLALAAGLGALPAPAAAAEAVGKGTFATTLASRYVWRGQTLSEGLVLQPTVAITLGGFSANLWGNVDLDAKEEDDDGVALNETDVTLSYTRPVGPLALTAGFIHYDFDGSDTQEVYLTCAAALPLNPALTLYYDIDEGDGGFAVLALSQPFAVGPLTVTGGASVGLNLNDKAMGLNADGEDFTGLYYGEVSLATSVPLFGKVTLDPRVAYTTALGGDGEDAIKSISVDGRTDGFSASIAVTAAF